MLVVHVHVRIRPGQVEEFLAATLANARASLGEPGVLRFDVIQDRAGIAGRTGRAALRRHPG
jgi:autoinducer 2-degrading protein